MMGSDDIVQHIGNHLLYPICSKWSYNPCISGISPGYQFLRSGSVYVRSSTTMPQLRPALCCHKTWRWPHSWGMSDFPIEDNICVIFYDIDSKCMMKLFNMINIILKLNNDIILYHIISYYITLYHIIIDYIWLYLIIFIYVIINLNYEYDLNNL